MSFDRPSQNDISVRRVALMIMFCVGVAGTVSWLRDTGYGGPHHDEVIAMLASKAGEREFARNKAAMAPPFNQIVPAAEWQKLTRDYQPISFAEIRDDVLANDKHPPLAFWLFNRWLSLFQDGGYRQAVLLTWLQMQLAAVLVSCAVFRHTESRRVAVMAFGLFLIGNSAVFTGIWVRQYALLAVCYAMTVLFSAEVVRQDISRKQIVGLSFGLGLISLAGMMSQYTFATMSAPIHLAVVLRLFISRQWNSLAVMGASYGVAGILFLLLIPGALNHASVVTAGMGTHQQITDAFRGVSEMYVPMPSAISGMPRSVIGFLALAIPIAMALSVGVGRQTLRGPDVRVPLAGMMGAGVLQFALVATGRFPAWATGPNHLCCLWILTVLSAAVFYHRLGSPLKPVLALGVMVVLLGMQGLFAWRCHQILPGLNTAYVQSLQNDLVLLDNLSRGYVLQVTEVMAPHSLVLVADDQRILEALRSGELNDYQRILYLPMDTSVSEGKPQVLSAARDSGRRLIELPVTHVGMFEAVQLTVERDDSSLR